MTTNQFDDIKDVMQALVDAIEAREVKKNRGMGKEYVLGYVMSTVCMAVVGLPKTQQKKIIQYVQGSIDYVKAN